MKIAILYAFALLFSRSRMPIGRLPRKSWNDHHG